MLAKIISKKTDNILIDRKMIDTIDSDFNKITKLSKRFRSKQIFFRLNILCLLI